MYTRMTEDVSSDEVIDNIQKNRLLIGGFFILNFLVIQNNPA